MRRQIAVLLAGVMLLGSLVGCGEKESDTPKDTTKDVVVEDVDADTEADTEEEAPAGDITVGTIDGNVYTNESFGFKLELPDDNWEFQDAATMASSVGSTEDEINKVWNGEVTPYDQRVTYCVFAWDTTTGVSVIINYASTEKNYMDSDKTGREYLDEGAQGYPGSTVTDTPFLGDTSYARLQISQAAQGADQYMYAANKDGIIIMITFTIFEGDDIEDYLSMFSVL